MFRYIRWFKDLTIKDIPLVGGKNASLGEMYSKLTKKGVPVPNGFALTAEAYWAFIKDNKLDKQIKAAVKDLDVKNIKFLSKAGLKIRGLILNASLPKEVETEVIKAYRELSKTATTHPASLSRGERAPREESKKAWRRQAPPVWSDTLKKGVREGIFGPSRNSGRAARS